MKQRAQGLAVITGAASGMGEAVARRMTSDGWPVLLCDVNAKALAAIAEELSALGEVRTLAGDLSSPDFAERLASALDDEPVGALVHCAGLSSGMAEAARIVEVNLTGTLRLVDAVRPRMAEGGAAVLFTTMVGAGPKDGMLAGIQTVGDVPKLLAELAEPAEYASQRAYIGTKRAIQLLVRREAAAFGKRGARIVSLSPGIIDTPMSRHEQKKFPVMDQMLAVTPLGRMGMASEIASVVAFLCSPEASYVTGIDMLVDGGMVATRLSAGDALPAL
ncbi:MAG TPA: SDR family oxidoreductase [Novosphingobium sp.]|nr:SDR family oxidoreductase [Novosphingobium sp.]